MRLALKSTASSKVRENPGRVPLCRRDGSQTETTGFRRSGSHPRRESNFLGNLLDDARARTKDNRGRLCVSSSAVSREVRRQVAEQAELPVGNRSWDSPGATFS